ncbi:competence type IV pilus minor pilin ComGF [Virgibacillus salexigens]|uniref:competence type IV pilus minor pilin ComGF n=1 Tax=Virgibacillus TaxID=84406 RepID=UPI0009DF6AEB|nr:MULTISPECIES: competence type IV pilus minor pilin ComGF [Virgibacillus]MYL41780.1 hypothetical protein [Virgibacillus massiliensis]
MQSKRRKFFVYLVSHDEKGFTLIHSLFMIVILSFSLPFLSYLINSANNFQASPDELSAQQFFLFLRNEVMQATDYRISQNKLYLALPNKAEATFSLYGNIIRRQVNGLGHEIYLRNVKELHLSPLPYGFTIRITTLGGEQYKKDIVFYE